MILNVNQIKKFKKKGYILIKQLLNNNELEKYSSILSSKYISNNKKSYELYNKSCWNYLINEKFIRILKDLLGEKIYYMHDLNFVEHQLDTKGGTWHRDNPCRTTAFGPDWSSKFPYNVVTTITYMEDSNQTQAAINLIPKSHKASYKYSISNILRRIHSKNKFTHQNNFFIKNIININGKRIFYQKGDCIIFFSNLYHLGENLSDRDDITRRLIVSRFGGKGMHSENYVNYHLRHRKDQVGKYEDLEATSKFVSFLKKNDLYFPIPEKRKNIEGSFSTI